MTNAISKRDGFAQYIRRVIHERCSVFLSEPTQLERLESIVLALVPKNPKLLECSPESVALCLKYCAELQLEPSSALGHCYLIPRYSKSIGGYECTFLVGYKGYLELCRRYANVESIYAGVVYQGESFSVDVSNQGVEVKHAPSFETSLDRSPSAVVASYVMIRSMDGSCSVEWCTRNEIDERRKAGGSRGFSPWNTHFGRMARKCAIRKLFDGGAIQLSPAMARANEIEMLGEVEILKEERRSPAPRQIERTMAPIEHSPELELVSKESDGAPVDGLFEDSE
tara:strand:- start:1086 stop:1934 length:849 start_codon:yes stop_codon:yes gene_type:complete